MKALRMKTRSWIITSSGLTTALLIVLLLSGPVMAEGEVHVITSANLPLTLNSSYAYDTIRISGTKISTAGNGIYIKDGAHGVYFDFGADTLEFGTGGGDNKFGIRNTNAVDWGWNQDVYIKGGTILHGGNNNSHNCVCIESFFTEGLTIDGTNTIVRGIDSRCISTYNASSHKGMHIIGGRHISHGVGYESRDDFDGATIYFDGQDASLNASYPYSLKVENAYLQSIHMAMFLKWGVFEVANCTLIVDARNDLYPPHVGSGSFLNGSCNAGGVSLDYAEPGTSIHDNVILADSNYFGADVGIGMFNCKATAAKPLTIYNNYIKIHRGLDAFYGDLNVKGVKWRGGNKHVHFHHNTVIVTVDGDPSTTFRGPEGHAFNGQFVYFDGEPPDSFVTVENNTFQAIDVDGGADWCNAARFETESVENWKMYTHSYFRHNRLISSRWIYAIGVSGYDDGTRNYWVEGDTVVKPPVTYDFTVYAYGYYNTYDGSKNIGNVFTDIYYEGGASDDDIQFIEGSAQADVKLRRTLQIYVRGNNGLPVVNANVTVRNDYGAAVLTGLTDSGGLVAGVATYHYESQTQADSTKAQFNPFVLQASQGGDNIANNTFTVGWTAAGATDTLDLANTVGTGVWRDPGDIIPPARIIDFGVGSPPGGN